MHDRQRMQPSGNARALALGALLLAIVVVAYVVLSSGSPYQVRLLFSDASGLVSGDQVMIGPSSVGSVQSITPDADNGQAAIVVSLDGSAAPLYRGTVARIAENGLAGIASHYVTLRTRPGQGQRADPLGRHDTPERHLRRGQPRPDLRHVERADPPGAAKHHPRRGHEHQRQGARRPTGRSSTSIRCSRARARSRPRSTATSRPSTSCWCRAHRRCSCSPRAASS